MWKHTCWYRNSYHASSHEEGRGHDKCSKKRWTNVVIVYLQLYSSDLNRGFEIFSMTLQLCLFHHLAPPLYPHNFLTTANPAMKLAISVTLVNFDLLKCRRLHDKYSAVLNISGFEKLPFLLVSNLTSGEDITKKVYFYRITIWKVCVFKVKQTDFKELHKSLKIS